MRSFSCLSLRDLIVSENYLISLEMISIFSLV
jgi:hypothetical protein